MIPKRISESVPPITMQEFLNRDSDAVGVSSKALVPEYLRAYYWWAYIDPKAVKLFERPWLHEQPQEWRAHPLTEVIRVVKPHGKIVIVDYARPRWWHPLRYFFPLVLGTLEPFALDLWREEITSWLPELCAAGARKRLFFGGLYQLVTSWR